MIVMESAKILLRLTQIVKSEVERKALYVLVDLYSLYHLDNPGNFSISLSFQAIISSP